MKRTKGKNKEMRDRRGKGQGEILKVNGWLNIRHN